jgi:hypothetical protein
MVWLTAHTMHIFICEYNSTLYYILNYTIQGGPKKTKHEVWRAVTFEPKEIKLNWL